MSCRAWIRVSVRVDFNYLSAIYTASRKKLTDLHLLSWMGSQPTPQWKRIGLKVDYILSNVSWNSLMDATWEAPTKTTDLKSSYWRTASASAVWIYYWYMERKGAGSHVEHSDMLCPQVDCGLTRCVKKKMAVSETDVSTNRKDVDYHGNICSHLIWI